MASTSHPTRPLTIQQTSRLASTLCSVCSIIWLAGTSFLTSAELRFLLSMLAAGPILVTCFTTYFLFKPCIRFTVVAPYLLFASAMQYFAVAGITPSPAVILTMVVFLCVFTLRVMYDKVDCA